MVFVKYIKDKDETWFLLEEDKDDGFDKNTLYKHFESCQDKDKLDKSRIVKKGFLKISAPQNKYFRKVLFSRNDDETFKFPLCANNVKEKETCLGNIYFFKVPVERDEDFKKFNKVILPMHRECISLDEKIRNADFEIKESSSAFLCELNNNPNVNSDFVNVSFNFINSLKVRKESFEYKLNNFLDSQMFRLERLYNVFLNK